MKILKETYDKIIQLPNVPPECGGIIGGRFDVISEFEMVNSVNTSCSDLYTPDVNKLNKIIDGWSSEGIIDFYGIVHTHRPCSPDLSPGDTEYIKQIMISIADAKKELLFPIVIPQREILWYRAKNIGGDIKISKTIIEIKI